MNRLIYFAYGSNMSQRRLRARLPSAEFLGMGVLDGHALVFHKVSEADGSGKCGIVPRGNGTVYGALFGIAEDELPDLDWHEGNDKGYERCMVEVRDTSGRYIEAWTYVATNLVPGLRPFAWYKHHVFTGAREAGLPTEYVRRIEAVEAMEDPDAARASRELEIYG